MEGTAGKSILGVSGAGDHIIISIVTKPSWVNVTLLGVTKCEAQRPRITAVQSECLFESLFLKP